MVSRRDIDSLFMCGQAPPVIDDRAPLECQRRFGDLETQALGALHALARSLSNAGYGFTDVLRLTVYTVEPTAPGEAPDLDGLDRACRAVFANGGVPMQRRIPVRRLANRGWLVELEVVAVRQREAFVPLRISSSPYRPAPVLRLDQG